jgi:acetolactate synthase-1/2/3 large subunit
MPWDVIDAREPVRLVEPLPLEPPPAPDPDAVGRAVALLERAQTPMLMVGGGAVGAAAEIRELAERLQAPVVSFRSGRGIVADDHPLGFNCVQGFELWRETDVLLGIGTRLELQWFRWPDQPSGLQIVNVDVDPEQMERLRPAVAVVADAREAARALLDALPSRPRPSRRAELEDVKRRVDEEVQAIRPHVGFLGAIRRALPRDGFFVEEVCQAGFASYFALPVYEPRTFVSCGHQGTLGFGFPTALGVKAAHPDRAVVSVNGDGGFLFGLGDLATAAQYGLGLVTVVFDNGAYGNVLRDQERLFDGRVIGAELENPDFVALAESFGVRGRRAGTPAELEAAVRESLAEGGPAVIAVAVDRRQEVSPWRFLMPQPRRL